MKTYILKRLRDMIQEENNKHFDKLMDRRYSEGYLKALRASAKLIRNIKIPSHKVRGSK